MAEIEKKSALSGEQKVGFILLLIFALLIIILGYLQLRNTLYKSFSLGSGIPLEVGDKLKGTDALRYRDTDGDGLSDYDEIYNYSTSPYLEDSDSDGISDGNEVKAGSNPNCAKGSNCDTDPTLNPAAVVQNSSATGTMPSVIIGGTEFKGTQADLNIILSDPEKIRSLLVESGMSKTDVDQLTNEELLSLTESYRQTQTAADKVSNEAILNYNNGGASSTANTDVSSIRALLLQNGVPKEQLDKIPDSAILDYLKTQQ